MTNARPHNRRLRPVLQAVEREGLKLIEVAYGGKHIKLVLGLGDLSRVITVSISASCRHAERNMIGDVRRVARELRAGR